MATVPTLKHPERRAFAISIAAHAFLLILLIVVARSNEIKTLHVSLIVESEPRLKILPEEEDEEIITKRPGRKMRPQAAPERGSRKSGKASHPAGTPTIPEDQWSRYERQLHSHKSAAPEASAPAANRGTQWGSEKISKNVKHGESENVTIPKGDSKSKTRWRRGTARRLLTMPSIEYPESVRRKSGQGQVELQIEVNAQGRVEEVEIIKSSGYTRLDINARNAYRNAVFSPSPSGEGATGIIVVTFRMRDN